VLERNAVGEGRLLFGWRLRPARYRLPPGDDADLLPGLSNVEDTSEVLAEHHHSSELAALVERAADRFGRGVIDGEHHASMGTAVVTRNRFAGQEESLRAERSYRRPVRLLSSARPAAVPFLVIGERTANRHSA
jgi:hypothetical protein